ncbi:hypothetical protein ACP70R_020668 [Stipagrostis hirtigluma subsp. patula]
MVVAVASVASGKTASVVVGLDKCADCATKNMKAEAAFKGTWQEAELDARVARRALAWGWDAGRLGEL